jgi:glycine betaine/proline transport system substrate-binding protein
MPKLRQHLPPLALSLALACAAFVMPARAAETSSCRTVRMSDPGWTDIASTNGVAGVLLKALGYRQEVDTLSVPIAYQSLAGGKLDVFLGNWMPAQQHFVEPLLKDGKVDLLRHNLTDAKFTLAVPDYVAQAGVRSFADLAAHADQFDRTIYGIEPGAIANQNIQHMLDAKDFGLSGWHLVESSEQGMLAQVSRDAQRKKWVVFLAWEPHPMNTMFPITYLSGGDKYFGPNYGDTTINTLARKDYAASCPNVARLFQQLAFTVPMENEMMVQIADKKRTGDEAAASYLKAHPDLLGPWLDGVTTRDGKPGLAAVQAALDLKT